MAAEGDVLTELQEELVRRFGTSIRIHRDGAALVVTCAGADPVCVSVDDLTRPSFAISYPAFSADAHGWKDLKQEHARGVLLTAVVCMVEGVVRDGAILPEFPNVSLRRSLRRGRARQEGA